MENEAKSPASTREPTGDTIVLLYEARPSPPDLTGHSLALQRELLKLGVRVETHSFSPDSDLREETAGADPAGRHRVIMARGDRLAVYRERGAYRLPFVAVGVPVSEKNAEQVVNFVNVAEALFVARMVCIFLLDRLVHKQLVLTALIQSEITTLVIGSMDERYNVLREMGSIPIDSRHPVCERLFHELTVTYSPQSAHLTELRAVAQYVRGWLISALGALGGNESASLLASYYRSGIESDETARYWLLANLFWVRSGESPQIAREAAAKDPSDLVRKLALAILAWDSPEELGPLMLSLRKPENSHDLWTALRALQIVPIPAAFEAVLEVTAKTSEVAFMYDGLLVLYEYLDTRQPGAESFIEQFRNAVPAETAARIVLAAAKGASETYLRRFVWLLRQLEVPPIAKIFEDSLLHTDPEVALTARRLLAALGIVDAPVLPVGTERLRLAFAAVIRHPRQYQVIESLAPERLATLARSVPHPPAEVTEPLWEAWMEVVHAARLSDQPLAATFSPATKDDNQS